MFSQINLLLNTQSSILTLAVLLQLHTCNIVYKNWDSVNFAMTSAGKQFLAYVYVLILIWEFLNL